MKQTKSVSLSESVAKVTGRKLDFAIIGLLALAVGFMFVDNYMLPPDQTAEALVRTPMPEAETRVRELRSIAALPFSNESADEENAEFFANGIHDELLTQLAKIGSLKVISRTSVEEYRNTSRNMREIGQELGVATLLEGRVQRAGDMVRINVQLIDAETDEHLWAETYNRELTAENIFAIQGEMATSIANALEATLTPSEIVQLSAVPTYSTQAWNLYVMGNDYFNRPNDDVNGQLAIEHYQRAVEEDSNFSQAWAALSRANSVMYLYSGRANVGFRESAEEAIDRAAALAPDAPETHLARAQYFFTVTVDHEAALRELALAEQSLPNTTDIFKTRAYIQRRANNWEDAVVSMTRAAELDPRSPDTLSQLISTYLHLRDYASAERLNTRFGLIAPGSPGAVFNEIYIPVIRDGDFTDLKVAVENQRAFPFTQTNSWLAALYDRDYESAAGLLAEWDIDTDQTQNWYVPKASYYGVTYELAGEPDLAVSYFEDARDQIAEALDASPDDPRLHVALGEVMLGLGERDEAIAAAVRATELMSRSIDALNASWIQLDAIRRVLAPAGYSEAFIEQLDEYLTENGWWSIESLLLDPRFDLVRDDPRLEALVQKFRRP